MEKQPIGTPDETTVRRRLKTRGPASAFRSSRMVIAQRQTPNDHFAIGSREQVLHDFRVLFTVIGNDNGLRCRH
jgi:hypothetical protein